MPIVTKDQREGYAYCSFEGGVCPLVDEACENYPYCGFGKNKPEKQMRW